MIRGLLPIFLQNDGLESSEVKENEQVLETSKNCEEQTFSETCEVNKEDLETVILATKTLFSCNLTLVIKIHITILVISFEA